MPLTEKRVYLVTVLALILLSIFCIWMHVQSGAGKVAPIVKQTKVATLTAAANNIVLTLSGSVPNQATKTNLINSAEKVFGLSNVVDQIEIKSNIADPIWIDQARAIFPLLKSTIKNGTIAFKDKTVEVSGEVSGEDSKTKILRILDSVAGANLTVNDQLQTPNSRGSKGKKSGPLQVKLNELLLGKTVQFDSSSSRLRNDNHKLLDAIVDVLKSDSNARIEVSGHTDKNGKEEKNVRLSQRRAEAVKKYLVDKGIKGSRIEAIGHGSSQPIADETTLDGQRKNRRIEFNVQE
jgi:OmpA-OmpF porin, OOP family